MAEPGAEAGAEPKTEGEAAAAAGTLPLDLTALQARFPDVAYEQPGIDGWPVLRLPLKDWRDVIAHLRDAEGFNILVDLLAVDWPERPEGRFDLVAILRRLPSTAQVRCETIVDGIASGTNAAAPGSVRVPSLTPLFESADWVEREVYDLMGIAFEGHPDMRRILLPDDWEGHPLRRDYPVEGPRVLDPTSKYAH